MKAFRLHLVLFCIAAFGPVACTTIGDKTDTLAEDTAQKAPTVAVESLTGTETPIFDGEGSPAEDQKQDLFGTAYRKVDGKSLIRQYTIESDEMNTLRGNDGTLFHFPRHCFTDKAGKPVHGQVKVQIGEVDKMSDFALAGIPTATADGTVLSTRMMIYLNARQGATFLKIDPEKPVLIQAVKTGTERPEIYYAVHGEGGKPIFRTATIGDEKTTWKVSEYPVQPSKFQTIFSPEYCAYKCFDRTETLLAETAVPLMEHLTRLAVDTLKGGKTAVFASEGQILKAKPRVSRLEKDMQKYIFVQDKLYTRDRKSAEEAEKLLGMRIIPAKLNGTVLLTDKEALCYDLTPAVEPAQRIRQFIDKYPYLKDNKQHLIALQNVAEAAVKAIDAAPVFQTEEEVVNMIKNGSQADSRPTYFRFGGKLYANLKAVRLFAPTFQMKDEAFHDGKLARAKFTHPAVNARFVEYKHFNMMIRELVSDLKGSNLTRDLPGNVPVDMLHAFGSRILSYSQTATENEKQAIEFFKYNGRFYVAKQYLNPLIHTLAQRNGFNAPTMNAHELMNQLASIYHRNELKDPYLKYNYLDMTVAVQPGVKYTKEEREEVYQKHETMDLIRKNAHQDTLAEVALHTEGITCRPEDRYCMAVVETGWFALANEVKPAKVTVKGTVAGIIPDNSVTLHVFNPQLRTYLTFASKDGAFQFDCPKGENLKLLARFGNNVSLVTLKPQGNVYNAGEVTLLLCKPQEIEIIMDTI